MATKEVKIQEIEPLILEKLETAGKVSLTVKGNSMFPFFQDGKTSVTLKKAPVKLKKYDICMYHVGKKVVLHRLIKISQDDCVFMGDGLRIKEYIKQKEIFAIVSSYQTKGKKERETNGFSFYVKSWMWVTFRFLRRGLLFILRRVLR